MISIVIPAYNEESVLNTLLERLTPVAARWKQSYEIIFIDDGSADATWRLIAEANAANRAVRGIRLSRNFGHQAALTAGLKYAQGDAVIVMDADLQDPPEILNQFIAKWKEGYEVVYAVRKKRKENVLKRWAYFSFYRLLQKLADIDIPLDAGDFCIMDKRVVADLNKLPEKHRFIRGLRSWVGYRQTGLAYERHARQSGDPKYTFRKLIQLALNGLISFSSVPLRLASMMGFIIAGITFFGFLLSLILRIFNLELFGYNIRETPGTATILLTVLFLGGIQLISIGIIGEYMGHIFEEVKRRPTFVPRDTVGFIKDYI
ncbi:glycosyltransferase family 2 protein [bacterium]|nr:glycosyltransferase family 2 protein [bacterium]